MKGRIKKWMYGRYGVDRLSIHMLFISIILMTISLFITFNVIYFVGLVIMIISYMRVFSKNKRRRYKEFLIYENMKRKRRFINKNKK